MPSPIGSDIFFYDKHSKLPLDGYRTIHTTTVWPILTDLIIKVDGTHKTITCTLQGTIKHALSTRLSRTEPALTQPTSQILKLKPIERTYSSRVPIASLLPNLKSHNLYEIFERYKVPEKVVLRKTIAVRIGVVVYAGFKKGALRDFVQCRVGEVVVADLERLKARDVLREGIADLHKELIALQSV